MNNPPNQYHQALANLNSLSPFAQGANRFCFQHPDNPDRCLKVIRPGSIQARYQKQSAVKRLLGKSRLNDNTQELRAHQQPAIKRLIQTGNEESLWSHLPRFYGRVATTLGIANESELLRCKDGSIAPTLESLIRGGGLTPELLEAIQRFENWLTANRILTRNLLPHNLVVTDRTGQPELFLVDGLGAPAIPQALASAPGWSERYIERKIRRFEKRLAWEQDSQGHSWEDFQRLR